MRSILFTLAVATFAVGCSHPVDSAYDKAEDTINKACENCAEERGITVNQCLGLFDFLIATDAERECLKSVGDRHESAGPYYDCVNDKAGDYQSCMDSAGCNEAAIENCGNIFESIGDVCPLPSGDAIREIDACDE